MKNNSLIAIIIFALVFVGGTTVALLLPDEITPKLIVSVAFTAFAFLVYAASTLLAGRGSLQNATQNTGISTAALMYFIFTLIASFIFFKAPMALKTMILLEVLILIAGVVLVLLMVMVKNHIESDQ